MQLKTKMAKIVNAVFFIYFLHPEKKNATWTFKKEKKKIFIGVGFQTFQKLERD